MFTATLVLAAGVSALGQDLVSIAPDAAKVVYEDARIRVVRLSVPPDGLLPMHDRPARVVVPITINDARITRADGTTRVTRSENIAWSEPTRRTVRNLSNPLENIIVELKTAQAPGVAVTAPPTQGLADAYHAWLFENQYVRVYDARIPAGQTTGFHRHGYDAVTVVISGGRVTSQQQGESWGKTEDVAPGTVTFAAGSKRPFVQRLRNDGTAEFRMAIVQLRR